MGAGVDLGGTAGDAADRIRETMRPDVSELTRDAPARLAELGGDASAIDPVLFVS